jgi:hypothetical protein
VTQDPRYRFTKYEEEPLLLRHVTPLTRRYMIYFCFGAYITSVNLQVDLYPEVFGKFMSKTRTIQAMNQNDFQW